MNVQLTVNHVAVNAARTQNQQRDRNAGPMKYHDTAQKANGIGKPNDNIKAHLPPSTSEVSVVKLNDDSID